jgi:hypothetical protein
MQRLRFLKKIQTATYLLLLFIDFVTIGLISNGYSASLFVLAGTVVVICYIIRVGTEATALASIWVVGLMSVGAIRQLWFHGIPRPEFKLIPFTLLVTWLFALATVWWLGKASNFLRQKKLSNKWAFFLLICSVFAGLTSGWQLYNQILLFF